MRSNNESSSELPLPRLTLKRVRPNKLAERKIDQVLEENEREVEDEWAKVQKKKKKKKKSETTICTVDEKQVLEQSVAIKKAHKPKAMSSDGCDGKEERQEKKKQQHMQKQPKAELAQLTNEPSSSCMMHAPCQDGARAGTSAAGSVSSPKQSSLHEFWVDKLKKHFNKLEYSKVLRDAEFTEEQREIQEQSFAQLARKMSYIKGNSDRFLKTHKCNRCEFSILHQCMPLDFIRSVPFGTELMDATFIQPGQTVICDCGFAFSHVHLKRTRTKVEQSYVERVTTHLKLYNRDVDLSCPKCYTRIIMNHSADTVCCDLGTWDCIAGYYRKTFYTVIESCFRCTGIHAPTLDELFACSKGCCLIYHRCSEKVEFPGCSDSATDTIP